MATREELRAKLEHVIKVLQQLDKDLVLEEEEKEDLLDKAIIDVWTVS